MKRKLTLVTLLIGFLFLGSSTVSAASVSGTLWAGNAYNAGDFYVSITSTGLEIDIYTLHGWKLVESHVSVRTNLCYIPQTGNSCNGNPKLGHFIWSQTSSPTTDPHSYSISFSEIPKADDEYDVGLLPGTYTLYICIHAVVVKTVDGCLVQEETAFGGPCISDMWDPSQPFLPSPFGKLGSNRWGYYFTVEVTVL